jgi:hypothetical protein
VPGLPVYAAADTRPQVERAIRATLAAYLEPDGFALTALRVNSADVTEYRLRRQPEQTAQPVTLTSRKACRTIIAASTLLVRASDAQGGRLTVRDDDHE